MSKRLDKVCGDARALRDRLKAEGRFRDAEIIQCVIRSCESSSTLNCSLSRELIALRAEMRK
jgi:hypothetical protein